MFRFSQKRLYGNKGSHRSKNNRRIQWLGWDFVRSTGPNRAHRPGKLLIFRFSWPGKSVNLMSLIDGHLSDDMSGRPEAIYAEPATFGGRSSHRQRSIANQSSAEKRSGFDRGVKLGQRKTKGGVGN